MVDVLKNLKNIKVSINNSNTNIIAVSKTFPIDKVKPLYEAGHLHFGENKVQEAKMKWASVKQLNPKLKLHMIGKLQSNKAKDAVALFDYIHSLDNEKLANALAKSEKLLNKKNKYFIQVNIGKEEQKSGIRVDQIFGFYNFCQKILIDVIGLMCIPPIDKNPKEYFTELVKLNKSLKLKEISMGMSSDYLKAVDCGSTFVRIGSAIFGNR